ncbi:DUF4214 domain-containing protein [Massilia sp. erpn]|uniref:DUF4214 domain-containing protein n=1 Tax=Massilia sp. erpn TaxID=2738142 RepID=UPI002104FEE4|nr:DUF4214 domain-containing protein [Massilia sp. erpn]UTY59850.1 DUF4214 domain-containing protein [Massilia sp. erpn]
MVLKKLQLAVLLTLPVLASPALAQSKASLFGSAAPAAKASVATPAAAHVKKEKAVSINFQHLLSASGAQTQELEIELFDDTVTAVLDRVERRSADNYTWYGHIKGFPASIVQLTVVNNFVSGNLYVEKAGQRGLKRYELSSDAAGAHVLREIDDSKLPEDHPRTLPAPAFMKSATQNARSAAALAAGGSLSTAPKKIDVMVLYTNSAANAAGAAIGANVQAAIDSANQTFANSQTKTRVRLVYSGNINYNDSSNATVDLANLAGNATVSNLRSTYGADVVMVLAENLGDSCGQASQIGSQSNTAIAMVKRSCIQQSFAHEMGHLFGARHDVFKDNDTTPYAYGHGYVDKANKMLTVMAYPDACKASNINDCVRYLVFSSPLLQLTLNGKQVLLGTAATEDNRRVIMENTARIADFLPSKALQETGVFGSGVGSYSINQSGANFTVSGPEGTTVFDDLSANRLRFADATIALDINGNAGDTYRLYQAAFNRKPDAGGLGFWIAQADRGTSMTDIAASFITSQEFINLYGANPSNATFLNALYNNVLHRAPDQGGYNFWLTQLNNGASRAAVLASFASSQENRDGVAASLTHGITYTVYASVAAKKLNLASPFGKR